jgi:hypothetical protein
MKNIKSIVQIKRGLDGILLHFFGTPKMEESTEFVFTSKPGQRPIDLANSLDNYIDSLFVNPEWQPLLESEFHELQPGVMVRRKASKNKRPMLVDGNYGSYVTCIASISINNPAEWYVWRKGSGFTKEPLESGNFNEIQVGDKMKSLSDGEDEFIVTQASATELTAAFTMTIYCKKISQWEMYRDYVPNQSEASPMSSRSVKVSAIFTGADGSLGYTRNSLHELETGSNLTTAQISITRQDGTGKCEYGSVVAFLENWDLIRNKLK